MSNTLGRFLLSAVIALSLVSAAAADNRFLPADQAFSPDIQRSADGDIAVTWQIADGYYLYRHALDFKLQDSGSVSAGEAELPPGDRHKDQFFGSVETYRHKLRVTIPVQSGKTQLPGNARLRVTYRGCADAGLCYPPQTKALEIPPRPTPVAQESGGRSSAAGVSPQQHLATRLSGTNKAATLLLFLGLGILLAFTPCILPMIPILMGLIAGSGAPPRRAFALSVVYVLAMAAAYGVIGVLAGYLGANIQAALQVPAVLWPFAAVFVLLALASFGLFDLALPDRWQQRFGRIGTRRGGWAGAGLMGFCAALIAGPCLAPPLAGALLYISTSGDVLTGGAALFLLGLGMGLPLIAIATFGARILPSSGPWMQQIRVFFGVILLGVAVWLASRLVAAELTLAGWGLLALGYGAWLSTRKPGRDGARAVQRAAVFLLWAYAGCAALGVAVGGGRPLQPLSGLAHTHTTSASASRNQDVFTRVHNFKQLQAALEQATNRNQPAVIDFYADWCVDCVRMAHTVYQEPRVRQALSKVAAIQVDVTDSNATTRRLMQKLDVFGPPTLLFFRPNGEEARAKRTVGPIDAQHLIHAIQTL